MIQHVTRLVIFISICYGCKPPARESDPLPDLQNTGMYIVNEGGFMSGNGSVSFYDSSTNTVTQDLFALKNNKPAGDVCQSLSFFNNTFYLVVNNSGKVEVLDADFINTKTITGLTSPRYIAYANTKGYITDLYGKGVSVLNTNSNTIEKKIAINYWTEEILSYHDTLYVTSPRSKYLYLIDATNELLKDSIDIGYGSSSLAIDHNNLIWILCDGNQSLSILPSMVCINPMTRAVVRTLNAASYSSYASKINYNPTNKSMYWIDGGVYKIDTDNNASFKELVIDGTAKTFYGLAIKPTNGDVAVSDAGDYSQRSIIYLYTASGVERNSFRAGVISGYIFFK